MQQRKPLSPSYPQSASRRNGRQPVKRGKARSGANGARPVPPRAASNRTARRNRPIWRSPVMLAVAGGLIVTSICILSLLVGAGILVGAGWVLPGVSAVGVDLSNMSEDDAARELAAAWTDQGVLLRDAERVWSALPGDAGIELDAHATAAAARAWGRSDGGIGAALESLTSGVEIDPVLRLDLGRLATYLQGIKIQVDQPAVNAGVQLVNGQAVARPAQDGRELDITATVERLRINGANELADGALDLVMRPTYPAIQDASGLVAQANALLNSPFTVRGYDPIRDEWHDWSAPPTVWAEWLSAESDPGSPTGLALAMNAAGPRAFLESNGTFSDERYIEIEAAVSAMLDALHQNQTTVTIRVWHGPTTYTVQGGQTLAAIAEDVGIPYPYIQAENPGINADALSVGQTLQLPSRDILVPLNPIAHKRIVISRNQQHLWAYENGQVVFDWVISTGISTSPTALGTFQVQSHDPNAYADQWNLYMPNFMGFYHPGPNMELMNGFHGFPTRGGGYLLWTDDLGHPVTYGCVLLSLQNAQTLYEWAEDGVVVEVRAS